jgi:hypothetical protein
MRDRTKSVFMRNGNPYPQSQFIGATGICGANAKVAPTQRNSKMDGQRNRRFAAFKSNLRWLSPRPVPLTIQEVPMKRPSPLSLLLS